MKSPSKNNKDKISTQISLNNEKNNEKKNQKNKLPYFNNNEKEINSNNEDKNIKKDDKFFNRIETNDYLKSKIHKLNNKKNNNNNNLNNGFSNQSESDNENKHLLITQMRKDNFDKINQENRKKIKSRNQNYEEKKNHQILEKLKSQKNKLKNRILKLKESKSLIEKESNLTVVDENINKDKLKEIESKTIDTTEKIKKLDYEINDILHTDSNINKKDKIKLFLINFEKEKEIAEIRAKKYSEESKKRKAKMKKDIDSIINKRKKEIDLKEEEEKKQRIEYLKKLKERDKETRFNIEKIKDEKFKGLKVEEHIKDKINTNENNYLFNQLKEKFIQKEEDLIKNENKKRKYLMRSIPFDEIKEFEINYLEKKLKYQKDLKERSESFKKEFYENNYIPNYISHFRELSEINCNKLRIEREKKRKKIEGQIKTQKVYSERILSEKKPNINLKLKKEREDKILKLTEKKIIKDTLNNHKKNRILLIKRDPNKPLKYNWDLKLDNIEDNSINKSFEIIKPKRIPLSLSISRKKLTLQNNENKQKDYLEELKKEREEKEKNKRNNENDNKILRYKFNAPNINIYDKVNHLKLNAINLSRNVEENEKLLKKKGGIEKNPELGEKFAYLLIDSIETKLSILNTVDFN